VKLPDFYETVAQDAMALAKRDRGLWAITSRYDLVRL
jgi:hypothetical protein